MKYDLKRYIPHDTRDQHDIIYILYILFIYYIYVYISHQQIDSR